MRALAACAKDQAAAALRRLPKVADFDACAHPGSAPAERRASLAQRRATPADGERLRTACSKAVGVSNACAANDKRDAHTQAQARRGQSVLPLADFLWFSNSITAGSVIRKGQA